MRTALFLTLLGLLFLPLRAEDWTTSDGKTYKNVQVLSHNTAFVTILHQDGGGRVPLSTLSPDLQKRFAYDPAKAPAILAATQQADQRDQAALAKEKSWMQAEDEARQKAVALALTEALFTPAPNIIVAAANPPAANPATGNSEVLSAPSNAPSYGDSASDDNAISSEPSSAIDDWDYGNYGYGGYAGYGYGNYGGYYGYGSRYGGGPGSVYRVSNSGGITRVSGSGGGGIHFSSGSGSRGGGGGRR